MKMSQGWQNRMRFTSVTTTAMVMLAALVTFLSVTAQAASLSVRDITITGKNKVDIQFDGTLAQNNINLDYVRDNIQFSFQNATIYPAKMIHAENSVFNKVFAYQYAPNLVRIRFTVTGQADQYKGQMRWSQNGKGISITFPDSVTTAAAPKAAIKAAPAAKSVTPTKAKAAEVAAVENDTAIDEEKERSLLSRVMGRSNTADEPQREKAEPVVAEKKPLTKNTTTNTQLGGAKSGPSAGRSFLILLIMVGGLATVLFVVKKKKSAIQATVVGKTWWSNLLPAAMRKPKSFIEVMGTHALGPKQSIVVIRIRGQQFVLGVTQDNVQLITQLDADESEVDVLGDPAVSESIGIMFGSKPTPAPITTAASFNAMLGSSTGAGAIISRNAYQAQVQTQARAPIAPNFDELANSIVQEPVRAAARPEVVRSEPSIRDQIRRRLESRGVEGMQNS